MSEKRLSVLLVGIGGYGANFVDEFLNRGDDIPADVVGCIAPHPQKAFFYQALCDRNIPIYTDINDFWEARKDFTPAVDLAVLSTPINFHKSGIIDCMRHGAQVLCEKPVCATIDDVKEIIAARDEVGGTCTIGYQWSHSEAITKFKADILAGKYGKPLRMKTLVLWPRDFAYYGRGSGWAGKVSKNGEWTLDSVASNATAHYLHNIFFCAGNAMDRSADIADFEVETYRANDIETYDTCVLRGHLAPEANNADILFVVSHALAPEENFGPVFEYEFENGTCRFERTSEDSETMIGYFKDGTTVDYGVPSGGVARKLRIAVDIALGKQNVICGPEAASIHTKTIDAITEFRPDTPVFPEELTVRTEERVYVKGLADVLHECYENWKLPSEIGAPFATEKTAVDMTAYDSFGMKID